MQRINVNCQLPSNSSLVTNRLKPLSVPCATELLSRRVRVSIVCQGPTDKITQLAWALTRRSTAQRFHLGSGTPVTRASNAPFALVRVLDGQAEPGVR